MRSEFIYDLHRIKWFFLGMREFRSSFTQWVGDWGLQRSYDSGREWAHRLTWRRYE